MVYSPYQSDAVKTLGTVYVVDDDEAVRDSIRWLLEASDYRVELYDSGESFIAKYDPREIAVLLLDVRMSGMSGLEVQEHLLARRADIPIISSQVTAMFRWPSMRSKRCRGLHREAL